MTKQITVLMCSPRGEKSASHSLASDFTNLFQENEFNIKFIHIYKTLNKEDKIRKMIESIDQSEIVIISSPLYVDTAPYMTIKLMDIITENIKNNKIRQKKRLMLAISCAGYLEYYHNNIALKTYELFAQRNGFTWAGGIPIGAAGTYVGYPLSKMMELMETLPEDDWRREYYGIPATKIYGVMKKAVEYLSKGEIIPKNELEKLQFVAMPLGAYVEGGNRNWVGWAEKLGTADKLREKPYKKNS